MLESKAFWKIEMLCSLALAAVSFYLLGLSLKQESNAPLMNVVLYVVTVSSLIAAIYGYANFRYLVWASDTN